MEQLQAFAGGVEEVEAARLVLRPGLVAEMQVRLAHHGLLDPPADGLLGPASQWALGAFCRAAGLPFEGVLAPPVAAALLRQAPVLPLWPDGSPEHFQVRRDTPDDLGNATDEHAGAVPPVCGTGGTALAGRIAAALIRRGDWLCRDPGCVNIVYVEGMDEQGRAVPRRPDAFDDLRLLLRIAAGGRPEILGAWCATTASGRPAVEGPAEPEGAPRLALGQHRAWVVGRTAIGTALEQEALVQVLPLPVTRDIDRDFRREGDPPGRGVFLIDQHGGQDAPRERVGGIGAGCLVGRSQDGHCRFMARLREDPRWRVNAAHLFTTSILRAEEVGG